MPVDVAKVRFDFPVLVGFQLRARLFDQPLGILQVPHLEIGPAKRVRNVGIALSQRTCPVKHLEAFFMLFGILDQKIPERIQRVGIVWSAQQLGAQNGQRLIDLANLAQRVSQRHAPIMRIIQFTGLRRVYGSGFQVAKLALDLSSETMSRGALRLVRGQRNHLVHQFGRTILIIQQGAQLQRTIQRPQAVIFIRDFQRARHRSPCSCLITRHDQRLSGRDLQ